MLNNGGTIAAREKRRFRYIATIQKGKLPRFIDNSQEKLNTLPYLSMEYLRGEIPEPMPVAVDSDSILADDDDLLLLWDGSNAGEFLHAKKGVVSSTIALIRPKSVHNGYFYWVCKSLENKVRAETVGMGIPHVNGEFLANLQVPIPPTSRQNIIADYLDRETTRIDALIATKKQLLELLTEKRRAIITHAVTRGLNPNIPLNDTGISWLRKIPAHWDVVSLRFLVDFTSGATPNTGNLSLWDGEIPWVSPKDMKRIEIEDTQDYISETALTGSSLHLIEPNAVLIVVRGMILIHSFPTAINIRPVTINQDMKALRCRKAMNPYYLRDYFRGIALHVISLADTATHGTRKLETEILGRLEICVPPLDEQQKIVSYIKKSTTRIENIIDATERTIDLLKERRAALITAAVTGQIPIEGVV